MVSCRGPGIRRSGSSDGNPDDDPDRELEFGLRDDGAWIAPHISGGVRSGVISARLRTLEHQDVEFATPHSISVQPDSNA